MSNSMQIREEMSTHEGAAGSEDDELREFLVQIHHPGVAPLCEERLHAAASIACAAAPMQSVRPDDL